MGRGLGEETIRAGTQLGIHLPGNDLDKTAGPSPSAPPEPARNLLTTVPMAQAVRKDTLNLPPGDAPRAPAAPPLLADAKRAGGPLPQSLTPNPVRHRQHGH